MKGIGRQSFLVVFDFDHTVLDCNSDEVVIAALGRAGLQQTLQQDGMQWTKMMDTLLAPFSRSEIVQAARRSIRVDPDMPAVFDYLHAVQQRHNFDCAAPPEDTPSGHDLSASAVPRFLEVDIASDANLLFIEAGLEACLPRARAVFSQIHSNPYYEVDGGEAGTGGRGAEDEAARDGAYNAAQARRSRLCWYEPQSHGCDFCGSRGKSNMCKSRLLHRILATTTLIDPTIVYVGDGFNDYCPVLNVLRPRDFVLARRGFALHSVLAGESGEGAVVGGCCGVGLWGSAKELLRLLHTVLEHQALRLPTLARFRDAGPDEFRAVTLTTRIPALLRRTVAENDVAPHRLTRTARQLLDGLLEAVQTNGPVPALPGQRAVPAWLRNYAYVSEFDRLVGDPRARAAQLAGETTAWQPCAPPRAGEAKANGAVTRCAATLVAPRWGQLPWVHGEIYFYHLVWQYMMISEEGARLLMAADAAGDAGPAEPEDAEPNIVTPYAMNNPLHAENVEGLQMDGIVSAPGVAKQGLCTDFLVREPRQCCEGIVVYERSGNGVALPELDTDQHSDIPSRIRRLPFASLLDPPHSGLLPPRQRVFVPYHDIFANEKAKLLRNFVHVRVVPMLACRPWDADVTFAPVLLRWMLWANALDLSMFTLDQLTASHGGTGEGGAQPHHSHGSAQSQEDDAEAAVEAAVRQARAAEATATGGQDAFLVGNHVDDVARYLAAHFQRVRGCDGDGTAGDAAAHGTRPVVNHVDIVMDNVGVECVADLCFGLWYLQQARSHREPPRVTYHVKPMPYYVSDVTAADIEAQLGMIESIYAGDEAASVATEGPRRLALEAILRPFVTRVRDAFASGAFRVDADTVWTQPSEYRDLPPRVVNRYFYTQRVVPSKAVAQDAATAQTAEPSFSLRAPSAAAVYRANKLAFVPRSALVVFKGDLNFRRLIGDRHWDRSDFLSTLVDGADLRHAASQYSDAQRAAVAEVLQDTAEERVLEAPSFQEVVSAFWPTHVVPVCAIRTIKSECCVGVPPATKEALDRVGKQWRTSGRYGKILFAQ